MKRPEGFDEAQKRRPADEATAKPERTRKFPWSAPAQPAEDTPPAADSRPSAHTQTRRAGTAEAPRERSAARESTTASAPPRSTGQAHPDMTETVPIVPLVRGSSGRGEIPLPPERVNPNASATTDSPDGSDAPSRGARRPSNGSHEYVPATAAGRDADEATAAGAGTTQSVRAARRELRKAARLRRRFEHAEVRRFTRRSRHRRATLLTLGSVLAVLVIVLAVAVYSPILALREITVDGTSKINAADVQAAVDDQIGTPLALLDFTAIRNELAAFPLVQSYVTETVPPNTLRIHIIERQAVAVIANGANFDQVDPAGVVVASSADRAELPLIDAGENGVNSAGFASAVEVLLAMPVSVSSRVDVVTARTADDVGLTLKDTTLRVVWGSADDSELKAQDLERLLAQATCTALPVIDVSAPLAPICGPN